MEVPYTMSRTAMHKVSKSHITILGARQGDMKQVPYSGSMNIAHYCT